ncbi:Tim44/TimA family putative adaptor protein [Pseudoruegeria sp. SK021]|uniref:Tim44/TimA family putative adaptor protein n=1 Tax=Pseudoruegeria sp. SK021 TaxID=1933035 RepID=UPI000A224948|nr:Tim44/TimA family putative adaptor protein [Pseudoruegeria sp. SK021]OSP55349.1 preprotein translocase subunit Tim44 [Pseudoruegeria sp. SK021]
MSSALLQLLVLAGVAIFLILRLKNVLGTREGFEKPTTPAAETPDTRNTRAGGFEVIEGGPDHDIIDHVDEHSAAAKALAEMKKVDDDFVVGPFLQGARGAYEMILMAFESGDLSSVKDFLSPEVYESFSAVIDERTQQGLNVEATFVGLRDVKLMDATFDQTSAEADLTVRFVAELTSVVKNLSGDVVEGSPTEIKRQRDTWTFSRVMGTDDPNWHLVATGE